MPRAKRFHGLKKVKVRQSWHKYNLYNLSRASTPFIADRTFYQQKFYAKQSSRAYHGEQIFEKHWQRQFDPRLPSVAPMDPTYLAANDGAEQAEGRGFGKDKPEPRQDERDRKVELKTPYMQMIYHPMERRLDTAIFRAMFASSTRMARQFCIHGWVKVNGKKMIYPGYKLNPGDMFSVDPDRVLWATGAPKKPDHKSKKPKKKAVKSSSEDSADAENESAEATSDPVAAEEATKEAPEAEDAPLNPEAETKEVRSNLQSLIAEAQNILQVGKTDLSVKSKQNVRALKDRAKKAMSRARKLHIHDTVLLEEELLRITAKIRSTTPSSALRENLSHDNVGTDPELDAALLDQVKEAEVEEEYQRLLEAEYKNPLDQSKPYATPWRPRLFMSAFAFIPRYLEVNQKVCSAVYLRHPVARPGLAEIPSPWALETNQLAFLWYLGRSKPKS